ncbi:MAG: dihydropteroate synthase, partial [Deltaproteobacteria bacterium]|nr:dihydropteroate synthase [Deltaproteobacteria bacterium]
FRAAGREVPLFVSVTVEASGTMLVGADVQAAIAALWPMRPDVLGLNCATGPGEMRRHAEHLSRFGPPRLLAMPNAGLPRREGGAVVYPLGPVEFARWVEGFVRELGFGIVGGCCGTTPDHLREVVSRVGDLPAPTRRVLPRSEVASLYQAVSLSQDPPPLLVGERCNANGSREFRDRLLAGDVDGMVAVAREQERGGAHLLDLSVAYVGRNERADMEALVPELARTLRLPLMIDSTDPAVLEAALQRHGGRCVINSINLEDGRPRLDAVAALAARYGAAVVALAIDEEGMALTLERKLAVAERILRICSGDHGLEPRDLIFDLLTFTVASGDEGSRRAAVETLEALRAWKDRHPDTRTILGVSNVSFGLKPAARRVLNSVFLDLAVARGLDQAIVNPRGILPLYRIDPPLREAARRLLLDDRTGGDPLAAYLALFRDAAGIPEDEPPPTETLSPEERVRRLVVDGESRGLAEALDALRAGGRSPLDIINGVLIAAMREVGELFGAGQMQLPFVLRSAEIMKAAVSHLEAFLAPAERQERGTLVLATVKGDVHDIGKNLVDIIVSNNGFRVVNLGIKVPVEEMIRAAVEHRALAVGMSGLLVKSTVVMRENLEELKRRGIRVPVLLGGAALNRAWVDGELREVYGPA